MLCELQYRKGLQHGADFTKENGLVMMKYVILE